MCIHANICASKLILTNLQIRVCEVSNAFLMCVAKPASAVSPTNFSFVQRVDLSPNVRN